MILLTWRPASSGWPCTKSCLTNSPRLFSGNSTEPSYQRGSPKLRLVKWPKQRHNLPASLKRQNPDTILANEPFVPSGEETEPMKDDRRNAAAVENRRLAAIMFTDIVGFSHQMSADEARTMRLLALHNQVIRHAVSAHKGIVIKTVGDGFLVDFPSVVNAVQGAQQIQAHLRTHNAETEPGEQIHVRIGIHLGDIIEQEGDVFGD